MSNDHKSCINFAHCKYFDEKGKCEYCDDYYNFNADKQCVLDYCSYYGADKKCK